MPKKLTIDEVIDRLSKINPRVTILSNIYVNSKTHLDCKCNSCDYKWKAIWNSLQKGIGCPRCSGKSKPNISKIESDLKNRNIKLLSKEYSNIYSEFDCECLNCGYKWKASYTNLIHNKTGCARCSKKLKHDIEKIKTEINGITVLSKIYKNNRTPLLCECNKCHHKWYSNYHELKAGKGCPLCNASLGEKKIYEWLRSNDIEFKYQHKFKDCKYKSQLVFDFYIPNLNVCVEFDGELHFKQTSLNCDLEVQKLRDNTKNEYCKDKNIKLIRIPYWEINKIEDILKSAL
jgi:very-short-patch-repair endonuclease